MKPALQIENPQTTIDRPVSFRVAGLLPEQEVVIRLQRRSVTPTKINHFVSRAAFQTNEKGMVDVDKDKPLHGSYSDIDGMGLIHSLEIDHSEPNDKEPYSKLAPQILEVILEHEGSVMDRKQITRYWKSPDVVQTPVRDNGLVATFFSSKNDEPRPGIIVVGGSEGGIYEFPAALLASHGFNVLALGYWGTEQLPKRLADIPMEYVEQAVEWMTANEKVNKGWLGIHGTSKGGELALLAGSLFKEIKAVVSLHGSPMVFSGIVPWSEDESLPPSWTFGGRPISYARPDNSAKIAIECLEMMKNGDNPFPKWYDFLGSDPAISEEAMIPIEQTQGPILLISGAADGMWNSTSLNDSAVQRLHQKKFPHAFEHISYPGAGHETGIPYIYVTANKFTGGTKQDTAKASIASWNRTISFFKKSAIT